MKNQEIILIQKHGKKQVIFTEEIRFERIKKLQWQLDRIENYSHLELDFRLTEDAHVSLVGLLLDLKSRLEKAGKTFVIKVSEQIKKILRNLKMLEYFKLA
jgi:anti-anti-sigma regulatory factor